MQRDDDLGAEAGHRLVDGVVDDFPDEVVQTSQTRGADVHARAATHRIETLQHLDVFGAVTAGHAPGRAFGGVTRGVHWHLDPLPRHSRFG